MVGWCLRLDGLPCDCALCRVEEALARARRALDRLEREQRRQRVIPG